MGSALVTADATAHLDTFPKWIEHNAKVRPNRPAMRHKDLGIWKEWTWAELARIVRDYALGLMAHGLQRGDKIAIIGANRGGSRSGLCRFRGRGDGLCA